MAYNSPLIVSTTSLNSSYGAIFSVVWPATPFICALLAVAIAVCYAYTTPVFLFIAVALAICFTPCVLKSTYVRP